MRILGLAVTLAVVGPACSSPRPAAKESGMTTTSEERPGEQLTLEGTARQAKGGAVVVGENGSVTYLAGLPEWPEEIDGQPVEVVGTVQRRKLLPSPTVDAEGAVSAGAEGTQRVLEGAPKWKKSLGRLTVVTGTARNAGAGPVIVTPLGPCYLHAVGERWPEADLGKTVTAVGKLLRKKRPSTPENDDSEFGGKPELTEEWALESIGWSLE